jgi:hypothetical protein
VFGVEQHKVGKHENHPQIKATPQNLKAVVTHK